MEGRQSFLGGGDYQLLNGEEQAKLLGRWRLYAAVESSLCLSSPICLAGEASWEVESSRISAREFTDISNVVKGTKNLYA